MLLGMLSILLYRSHKGFGYALGIDTAPEAMRPSKSQMREDTDAGKAYVAWEFFVKVVFPLLARESVKGKRRHTSGRKYLCRDR